MLRLPYGKAPYPLALGSARVEVLDVVPPSTTPPPLTALLDRALDAPIGSPRIEDLARAASRVTIIVSDHTRAEPRDALLAAIRSRLPVGVRLTVAIATGTHGPSPLSPLGIDHHLTDATLVNHDGSSELVSVGTTARGTPARVHRCVVETDLVVATGCIRPHYFAGFGAGAKAIFPGLGERAAIRTNHAWKTDPRARAGHVDGNPCREDLEEVTRLVSTPKFLLNGVTAVDETIHAAVAGDLEAAFRAGAAIARRWFQVAARPAPVVIASDALPITASLYQAAKLAAAAAPLVEPDGRLILVAECADGIGPLDVVNEAIFRIGVLPRLATNVRLELLSSLDDNAVRSTLLSPISRIVIARDERVIVLPHASHLIAEPLP